MAASCNVSPSSAPLVVISPAKVMAISHQAAISYFLSKVIHIGANH